MYEAENIWQNINLSGMYIKTSLKYLKKNVPFKAQQKAKSDPKLNLERIKHENRYNCNSSTFGPDFTLGFELL